MGFVDSERYIANRMKEALGEPKVLAKPEVDQILDGLSNEWFNNAQTVINALEHQQFEKSQDNKDMQGWCDLKIRTLSHLWNLRSSASTYQITSFWEKLLMNPTAQDRPRQFIPRHLLMQYTESIKGLTGELTVFDLFHRIGYRGVKSTSSEERFADGLVFPSNISSNDQMLWFDSKARNRNEGVSINTRDPRFGIDSLEIHIPAIGALGDWYTNTQLGTPSARLVESFETEIAPYIKGR